MPCPVTRKVGDDGTQAGCVCVQLKLYIFDPSGSRQLLRSSAKLLLSPAPKATPKEWGTKESKEKAQLSPSSPPLSPSPALLAAAEEVQPSYPEGNFVAGYQSALGNFR